MDDVRRCVSVAIRMHKADPQAGGVSSKGQPAYTFRIKASAKQDIRERLEQLFAYSHRSSIRTTRLRAVRDEPPSHDPAEG